MAEHNRQNDDSPIGMLSDGTLNVVQPGAPVQKLIIVGPDGTEYAPEDFDENGDLKEASDSFIKAKFLEAQSLRRANEHIIRERRQRSTGTGHVTRNLLPAKE